jgi:hypothetical protein
LSTAFAGPGRVGGGRVAPPGDRHRDQRGHARRDVRRSTSSAGCQTGSGPLRLLSAFRSYGSAVQDGLDASHMIVLMLVALGLIAAGAWLFERRDLL